MRIKHHSSGLKTLGPQSARLVTILHERCRQIFRLSDVVRILRMKEGTARSFVRKMVGRGVVSRLRPGLFILVPYELGRERQYMGNRFVVAREMMNGHPYYLSHASAMEIHGMLTQPQLVVWASSAEPMRARTILGTEFRFIRCKSNHLFGANEHWVDSHEKAMVSDLERTVVDGLKLPQYCGGFTEVAKGFWMRRADMNIRKLVDYALRLNVGSVIRRLGFLLETYRIEARADIKRLQQRVTEAYVLVDPLLLPEGKYLSRWRLRLNVSPEEIVAVVRT